VGTCLRGEQDDKLYPTTHTDKESPMPTGTDAMEDLSRDLVSAGGFAPLPNLLPGLRGQSPRSERFTPARSHMLSTHNLTRNHAW